MKTLFNDSFNDKYYGAKIIILVKYKYKKIIFPEYIYPCLTTVEWYNFCEDIGYKSLAYFK